MKEKKFKVHIYDWTNLTDRLILSESQINLFDFLIKNEYINSDVRYEVISEEESAYTDLT